MPSIYLSWIKLVKSNSYNRISLVRVRTLLTKSTSLKMTQVTSDVSFSIFKYSCILFMRCKCRRLRWCGIVTQ